MGKKLIEVDVLLNSRKFVNSKTTDDDNFIFLHSKSFTVRRNSPIVTYTTTNGGPHHFTYPLISNQPEDLNCI